MADTDNWDEGSTEMSWYRHGKEEAEAGIGESLPDDPAMHEAYRAGRRDGTKPGQVMGPPIDE